MTNPSPTTCPTCGRASDQACPRVAHICELHRCADPFHTGDHGTGRTIPAANEVWPTVARMDGSRAILAEHGTPAAEPDTSSRICGECGRRYRTIDLVKHVAGHAQPPAAPATNDCPECGGKGKIKDKWWEPGDLGDGYDMCGSCNGIGRVAAPNMLSDTPEHVSPVSGDTAETSKQTANQDVSAAPDVNKTTDSVDITGSNVNKVPGTVAERIEAAAQEASENFDGHVLINGKKWYPEATHKAALAELRLAAVSDFAQKLITEMSDNSDSTITLHELQSALAAYRTANEEGGDGK